MMGVSMLLGVFRLCLWVQKLCVTGDCLSRSLAMPNGWEYLETSLYHTALIISSLITAVPGMKC